MCWCWFHKHKTSVNQKLNSYEIKENMSFIERLELWLFFHTHPSSHCMQNKNMPSNDEFIVNPMRQSENKLNSSVEYIIGDS